MYTSFSSFSLYLFFLFPPFSICFERLCGTQGSSLFDSNDGYSPFSSFFSCHLHRESCAEASSFFIPPLYSSSPLCPLYPSSILFISPMPSLPLLYTLFTPLYPSLPLLIPPPSERMDEAKEELHKLLIEDHLKGIPVLIYANKQDLPRALTLAQV